MQSASKNTSLIEVQMIVDTPPEVNLKHLTKGRLIPVENIEHLKQQVEILKKNKNYYSDLGPDDKRFPKFSFLTLSDDGHIPANNKNTIIEVNNRLYAVYNKKIGEGGFGKVKAIQDVETGEWHAYKIQGELIELNEPSRRVKAIIEPELQTLEVFEKRSSELLSRRGKVKVEIENKDEQEKPKIIYKDGTKYSFMMPYISGVNLRSYIDNHQHISAIQRLDMAIQAVEEIQAIHQKYFLHCDIKISNMKYDSIRNKLAVLDYGLALKLPDEKSDSVKDRSFRGTRGDKNYVAPEIEAHEHDRNFVYSKSTDVFSLGVTFQELLKLTVDRTSDKTYIHVLENSPFNQYDKVFQKFIASMTDPDPAKRPTLEEVHKKLVDFRQEFLPVTIPVRGIVTLPDCLNALKTNNDQFFNALRATDSIYLVDNSVRLDVNSYSQLRNKLESMGISVESSALISHNPNDFVKRINERELQKGNEHQIKVPHICYIHPTLIKDIELADIESVHATGKHRVYRDEFTKSAHLVPNPVTDHVTGLLNKYYEQIMVENPAKESRRSSRAEAIKSTYNKLTDAKSKNSLTYFKLQNELDQLEINLRKYESKRSYSVHKLYITPVRQLIVDVGNLKNKVETSKNKPLELPRMKK